MSSVDYSLNLQTRKQIAGAGVVALVGATCFVLLVVALHVLRPDLNPMVYPASRYAVGPYGFLMTAAFFALSIASFALVIGLYRGVPPKGRSQIGLALLALWTAGVLVAMIFPMDIEGAPSTVSGIIHDVSGPVAFLSMSVGATLLSWRFRQDEQWQRFHRTALFLSLLITVGFLGTLWSFVTGSGFLGAIQRLTLAAMVTWMVLAAMRLRTWY